MIDEGQGEDGEELASDAYRAGFVFGRLCGLLYLALDGDTYGDLLWVEALALHSQGQTVPDCLFSLVQS